MIKITRTVIGEEIIGEATFKGSKYVIEHPGLIVFNPVEKNQREYSIMPYIITSSDGINIEKIELKEQFMFLQYEPSDQIKRLYRSFLVDIGVVKVELNEVK